MDKTILKFIKAVSSINLFLDNLKFPNHVNSSEVVMEKWGILWWIDIEHSGYWDTLMIQMIPSHHNRLDSHQGPAAGHKVILNVAMLDLASICHVWPKQKFFIWARKTWREMRMDNMMLYSKSYDIRKGHKKSDTFLL